MLGGHGRGRAGAGAGAGAGTGTFAGVGVGVRCLGSGVWRAQLALRHAAQSRAANW
jgi:hypothetical protein